MAILYLTEADVRATVTMPTAIAAVESAFRKLSLDEAVNMPRHRCQTDHVVLHVLPAAAKTLNALGFKAYTTAKTGNEFRLYLFDPKLGHLAAIVEADYLGQLRTGAASGVATKKLARADAHRAGIFGTGRQARTQLEAIAAVRKLSRVTVYSRDEDRRIAFAAVMSATLELDVVPTNDPRMAAHEQDIVITATSSREPVLLGE
ncbi:MAG: ornithine cyclodeaminase family protein, partial [Gemmataceae bacterium]